LEDVFEWVVVCFLVNFVVSIVSPWADDSVEIEGLVVTLVMGVATVVEVEVIGILTPVSSSWEVVLTGVWSPDFL